MRGSLKKQINPNIKAQLLRGALFLLLLLAVCVIAFALGRRLIGALSLMENPTGFVVCAGCWPAGWRAGPDMPSTEVRMVGVSFARLSKFYVIGGRSMDGVGNDFTHPFEYNPGTNTWTIKSASYPDNEVSAMACGVLNDSGTSYIYCVGGSAGGQTTATNRVFHYNPVSDNITAIPSPWPGDSNRSPSRAVRHVRDTESLRHSRISIRRVGEIGISQKNCERST